jgi:DNA primase
MVDIAAIRDTVRLSDVVGDVVNLRPAGSELSGCCPFHNERHPSFYVNDDKGLYFCHGCNAAGDIFEFVMSYYSVGFSDAVSIISGSCAGSPHTRVLPSKPSKAGDGRKKAEQIWSNATSLVGTIGEQYLCSRGISRDCIASQTELRFGTAWNVETCDCRPALIARVTGLDGNLLGIQRTFLSAKGRKLDVKSPKRSLGSVKGGAVKLGASRTHIIVCEGVEDGLSLLLADPTCAVWAVVGAGMMPAVELPQACRCVTIARDNDAAGQLAADAAAAAFGRGDRTVRIATPSARFKDWNEQHQAGSIS